MIPINLEPISTSLLANIIVFDIDGVLFNPEQRVLHYLNDDFETYVSKAHLDKPIPQGLAVCRAFMSNPKFRVLFVTGRGDTDEHRSITLSMLQQHLGMVVRDDQLLMRQWPIPQEEEGHDAAIKPLMLERAGIDLSKIFMVFEDRKPIVDMWRARGVVCYQTESGWEE